MGNYFSSTGKKQLKILMIGLDGSGKTTILYNLKLKEFIQTIPTIGFNYEEVKILDTNLRIWDVSTRSPSTQ